jgi:microcystin degradation protein MlrC
MRIGIGSYVHETNTFAPGYTKINDFNVYSSVGRILKGKELLDKNKTSLCIRGFLQELSQETNYVPVPTLIANAGPGPTVSLEAFDQISTSLINDLATGMPLDGIYLALHGANVIEGFDDGELELIRRVRRIVGNIPLVVSYDLHGNISPELFEIIDAAVGYRCYPHTDKIVTGARAFKLLERILKTNQRPQKAYCRLPFLFPKSCQCTDHEPAKSFYQKLEQLEEKTEGLHSLTLMEGFIPADIPFTGPTIFAYAESQKIADDAVKSLYEFIIEREELCESRMLTIDEAVTKAKDATEGLLVLADGQDNPGGGGSSDTTFLIKALQRGKVSKVLVGMIYDTEALKIIGASKLNSIVNLELGGRSVPGDTPFKADFIVEFYAENPVAQLDGPMMCGDAIPLGPTAVLRCDSISIVVSSKRLQCLDRGLFNAVGINPENYNVVVLKSSFHYQADFKQIAKEMKLVNAPGFSFLDPKDIPYTRIEPGIRLGGNGPPFKLKK